MKKSNYSIIKKHAVKDCYIIVNSLSGSIDFISNQAGENLINGNLKCFTDTQREYLLKRGYLVKDECEEVKLLGEISNLIHNKNLRNQRLSIAPTFSCNFACPYCFEESKTRNTKTLSTSDVYEIFEAVDNSSLPFDKKVFMFGGEPYMKENKELIRYIVKKCQERGMSLYGPTNGYDLDEYKDLLGEGKINNLQITIDGVGKTHNLSRRHVDGVDTFDKIAANIDYCLSHGIQIIARTNLSRKSVSEALKLQKFYEEKGWIENKNFTYSFSPVMYCEDSMTYEELFNRLKELGLSEELLVQHVSNYLGITKKLKFLVEKEHLVLFQPEGCTSCYNSFIVAPDKKLYTCGDLLSTDMFCGKLSNGRFEFNKLRDEWNSRHIMNMSKCSECPYGLYCGGSCATICIRKNVSIYTSLCNAFPNIFDKCLENICSNKIPCII